MADGLKHEEDELYEDSEKEPGNSKFICGIDTLEVENIVATRISKVTNGTYYFHWIYQWNVYNDEIAVTLHHYCFE